MSIHDAPLANYPHLIVTLIRQRTIKIVQRELAAKGVRIWDVTQCDLVRLAEAYFESHRGELIRVAIDTLRTGADLRALAEREARQRERARKKAQAVLYPKQIAPMAALK